MDVNAGKIKRRTLRFLRVVPMIHVGWSPSLINEVTNQ
jgi:hypothetical protein